MLKMSYRVFILSFLLFLSLAAVAQGPCPTAFSTFTSTIPTRSSSLICLVPQVYGAGGLVGVDHGGPLHSTASFSHAAHFSQSSLSSFAPLNAEIGTQLSQLPITSPASGFVFAFDPSLGVVARQTENFGPILTERADTIGRHKLFVGFSYQYFNFDKADGVNLKNFGAVFTHEKETGLCSPAPKVTCAPDGEPVFQHDYIRTQNRIDLKVHQFTAVATFGVTNRLDFSLAVPILDVLMDMSSNAAITSFEASGQIPPCCVHQFDPAGVQPGHEILFPANPTFGFNHALFTSGNSASGIGDLTFRGKYQVIKREKAGVAVGVDVRFPTGDERNFLGSGTYGTRPFVTFSYGGRISPHASLGYQINGNSILAGDINANLKSHLPNVLTYSAGVDAGVTHRVSLSLDFLGQTLQNAKKLASATYSDPVFNVSGIPTLTTSRGDVNQESIAVGGKVNPFGRLLLTANVLFRVNDAGLHSKPVPLVGISYTF
jgi:Putative MetA-pathway of phenol degradation